MNKSEMQFCNQCGSEVESIIPEGDDRLRSFCKKCQIVHYVNPNVVCGCIPVFEDKILLCKRAIEPRANYWTLPAGFMELGETTLEGAKRETWEEARARVIVDSLFCVFSVPLSEQVHVMFRAHMEKCEFSAGPESTDVALFSESEIPWDEIAFETIRQTLKHYFEDRANGLFKCHYGDVLKQGDRFVYRCDDEV